MKFGIVTYFLILYFMIGDVFGSSSLPSAYQPGNGVILESWPSDIEYSFDDFAKIPNFPSCPNKVENVATFETSGLCRGRYQHGRYRAAFVSPQTGSHKFLLLCDNACELHIEINPNNGFQRILLLATYTTNSWGSSVESMTVYLRKGFRYELMLYHKGDCGGVDFAKLGVRFPDSTEDKPISSAYLQRSMEYYKWTGVLRQRYENFVCPPHSADYSLQYALNNNPSYPNSPSSYGCNSSLHDLGAFNGEYYAALYLGYMSVPTNSTFTFRMNCDDICTFVITKDGIETKLGEFVLATHTGPGYVEMDAGLLYTSILYPVKSFFVECTVGDILKIIHKNGGGQFSTTWELQLQNLLSVETKKLIPIPKLTNLNSTTTLVQILEAPYLPPRDNWNYSQAKEVIYFEDGDEGNKKTLTVTGNEPQNIEVSGLQKFTLYHFLVHYFGKILAADQNIISREASIRTMEDVPERSPESLTVVRKSSSSIFVKWNAFTNPTFWNGVPLGYEIQYREEQMTVEWISILINSSSVRSYNLIGLKIFTMYQIRVAARTTKGSGPFSFIEEEKTNESIPSSAPANITAQNTSSSSIQVSWNDVPSDHQNGIITGYKVYIKKAIGNSPWTIHELTGKSFTKSGLDLWTFYDVKVSAKTSVGEGTISNATRARTDEDTPSGSPQNAKVNSTSHSLHVTWSEVIESQRNGIITFYMLTYRKVNESGFERQTTAYNMSQVIMNLEAFTEYEIKIAGGTRKGVGVFSSGFIVKTRESVPDAAPLNFTGHYNSSTSITVYWGPVPEKTRNGIIVNYILMYRKKTGSGAWKNRTLPEFPLQFRIEDLNHFTVYEIKIAASTLVGRGPFRNTTEIRTDADAPSKPPNKLTGHFLDHRSIALKWERVPEGFRHGITLGYRLFYKDISLPDQPWKHLFVNNSVNGAVNLRTNLTGLKIYTPYAFMIQAFNIKAFGKLSENVTVWTDEYAPEEPPRNINGQIASSNEILLKWNAMEEREGDANGKVLGYIVKYRVLNCPQDRPQSCNENEIFNITSNGSVSEIRIQNLRKYTNYSFSIQVFNSKGKGNFSKVIEMTTDEDKPDAPPTAVTTSPTEFDAIKVYWSPIPASLRNGIILGYRIFYKSIDTAMRQYHRAPRAINPLAVYGAEPGEQMIEVNATTSEMEISGLKNYSWYQVRIGAFTSKGLGVTYTISGTTKQGVPVEAPKFQVTDMYGFNEILLNWKPIEKSAANGEVLGYQIEYQQIEANDDPVLKSTPTHLDVLEPNRSVVVKELDRFSKYRIRISAFTEAGFGVWSEAKYGETCRCPKVLSSARIPLPPIVQESNLEILPQLINEAITSCCGNCSGLHGISNVDWHRDASKFPSVKYSRNEALQAISNGTHLALPIFKDDFETEKSIENSKYVYVSVLKIQSLLTFMAIPNENELGNAATSLIANSVWEQYPLFALSTVLTILAGIVFWKIEFAENSEEFSDSYFRGSGSGIWLAYITMTTVGYGDLVPRTILGRIYTIFWTPLGLVLTSMVVGNISSILIIDFVLVPTSFSPNGKVLASEDLLMTAAQFYGAKVKIGNVTDGNHIQESLLTGNISRVVLDIYKATSLEKYLNHPKIILEKVKKIQASYGVILSGDVKRTKKCVKRYVTENEAKILEKLTEKTIIFKAPNSENSPDLVNHMTSSSDLMSNLALYGSITLVLFMVIGLLHDIRTKIRGRAKVVNEESQEENMFESFFEDISNIELRLKETFSKLEKKHCNERLAISKMQYAKTLKLVSMYPALSIFDPSLPKIKTKEKNPTIETEEIEHCENEIACVDTNNYGNEIMPFGSNVEYMP